MKYLLSTQECNELRKKCYEKLLSKHNVYPLENDIPKYWLNTLPRCDDKGRVPLIYYSHDNENEYQLFIVYASYESAGYLSKGKSICWTRQSFNINDIKTLIDEVLEEF